MIEKHLLCPERARNWMGSGLKSIKAIGFWRDYAVNAERRKGTLEGAKIAAIPIAINSGSTGWTGFKLNIGTLTSVSF